MLTGCKESNIEISGIKVWSNNFTLIKTIDDSKTLSVMENLWMKREKVKPEKEPKFIYSIDIVANGQSTRWLYDPAGYVSVLSKTKVPVYKIQENQKFNDIITP